MKSSNMLGFVTAVLTSLYTIITVQTFEASLKMWLLFTAVHFKSSVSDNRDKRSTSFLHRPEGVYFAILTADYT